MCICINCRWIDRCITYHDVENNHGVNHICDVPDFKAKKPVIHVSIVKDNNVNTKLIGMFDLAKNFTKNMGSGLNVIRLGTCLKVHDT